MKKQILLLVAILAILFTGCFDKTNEVPVESFSAKTAVGQDVKVSKKIQYTVKESMDANSQTIIDTNEEEEAISAAKQYKASHPESFPHIFVGGRIYLIWLTQSTKN